MNTRGFVIGLGSGCAIMAVGFGLGLSGPQTRDKNEPRGEDPRPRWEYAELVLQDGEAALVTDRAVQKIEIPLQPSVDNTIFRNELGPMQRRFWPLMYSVNRFGELGWEIISDTPLDKCDRILVRRRR